ncbi:MAG: VanW family protein [Clostridia bacterium]|nr:VanW family protein [Clostridia bacterium]
MKIFRKTIKYAFLILVATFFATFCFSIKTVYAFSPILTITAFNTDYHFYKYETTLYNGRRYLNDVDGVIEKIYLDTIVRPTNSTIKFNPSNYDNPFTITKSSNGYCIDKEKLKTDVFLALNERKSKVNCKKVELTAEISESDNKKLTTIRGEFSTNYGNSITARKHNVFLATKSINGIILNSGETFSFNKVVGERNEKNGYQNAKIILNGEYVDGIGGGVCQVSTTLYNALLLSNLKITEKHAHTLQVSYVAPSFDAMVSGSNLDLKFLNDTNSPIYITGKANGNTLSFKVYGEKNDYDIKRVSKINEKIAPSPCEYVESDTLFLGEQSILQYEKEGIKSQGVLEYYKDGKKIKEIIIRKDYYKPVRAKILVGNKQKVDDIEEIEKQVDKIDSIR